MSHENMEGQQDAVNQATAQVVDARKKAAIQREVIAQVQEVAISEIDKHFTQQSEADMAHNQYRSDLIRQIGEAAKSGDFQRMAQLKVLLDESC